MFLPVHLLFSNLKPERQAQEAPRGVFLQICSQLWEVLLQLTATKKNKIFVIIHTKLNPFNIFKKNPKAFKVVNF